MMVNLLEDAKEPWLKVWWLMEILSSHVIFITMVNAMIGLT